MEFDQFLEKDILAFLDGKTARKEKSLISREEEYGLYLTKDYLKELTLALEKDELTKAKKLFDELKEFYNKLPADSDVKKKTYTLLETMYARIESYSKSRGYFKERLGDVASKEIVVDEDAGKKNSEERKRKEAEERKKSEAEDKKKESEEKEKRRAKEDAEREERERLQKEHDEWRMKEEEKRSEYERFGEMKRSIKRKGDSLLSYIDDLQNNMTMLQHENSRIHKDCASLEHHSADPASYAKHHRKSLAQLKAELLQKTESMMADVSRSESKLSKSKELASEMSSLLPLKSPKSSEAKETEIFNNDYHKFIDRSKSQTDMIAKTLAGIRQDISSLRQRISALTMPAAKVLNNISKQDIDALYVQGIAEMYQNDYGSAAKTFSKIIEYRPENKAARIRLEECEEVLRND